MPFKMGPLEIGIILVIVLIVFGVGKLPQVGGAVGKAIHSFRSAKQGVDEPEETIKPEIKIVKKSAVRKSAKAG